LNDNDRFDLTSEYLLLRAGEQQIAVDRMLGAMPLVRIVPGPAGASPLVLARIRYELTGQRQWIVAPTLELLDY
jgi:hypothetical protein